MWFSSVWSIWMLATFEYTKVECTKVECTKVECTYVYKPCDSQVSQAFECLQRLNAHMCLNNPCDLNACNVRMHENRMHVSRMHVNDSCSNVSSIWVLATFECTKVEYTYIYKPRDSRMSQVFEYSNARISRVILKCLKHSNVRNIRIYESRMHESRIYVYIVMWFSSVSSIRTFATFECTRV